MQTYQLQALGQSAPVASNPPAGAGTNNRHAVGSVSRPRHSIRPVHTRLLPALGAVALVLIAMLVGAYFWPEPGPSEPPAIPAAVVQPETPEAAEIDSNTLVDISFPAGAVGSAEESTLLFTEYSLPAGETVPQFTSCLQEALYLFHVEAGTMTIDLGEEAHVLRSGQTEWEDVPAGTAATVDAGDTLYYRLLGRDFPGLSNQGAQELRFLWIFWGGETPACETAEGPSGMTELWFHGSGSGHVDPTQPTRVVVRALSAEPGVTFPQEGPGALIIVSDEQRRLGVKQWISVRAGRLEYGSVPATPVSATPERTIAIDAGLILTEGTVYASDPNKRVVMMSAGDQPIDLAVLNVYVGEPDASGGIAAPE